MPDRTHRQISRPRDVIAAEQARHDRALRRGLIAFFSTLVVGGGLAFFVEFSPLLRGQTVLQTALVCLVLIAPLSASFIVLVRVPPPPFEALGDVHRESDKKQAQWRAALLAQIFIFSLVAFESIWMWPRPGRTLHWLYAMASATPMLFVVFLAVQSLYIRPGLMNPDLRPFLDDEVTRSFRARAQRLGYLLLLFILLGFCILARINAQAAAQFMPLGLAAGGALPLLYFVYLDWQASRGG